MRLASPALLLPTPTQRLVELDQSNKFIGLGLGQSELGGERVGLVSEYFQVIGGPSFEAHLRKSRRILR